MLWGIRENMDYEGNPNSIKYYVKQYLYSNRDSINGKTLIDFPAGSGVTTRIAGELGAKTLSFDIYPEAFTVEGATCGRADIVDGLPVETGSADYLVCQEGIEHFPDQLGALREFYRVLKDDGVLLLTTPNYSSIRSKLSYLLSESERFVSYMPVNEIDGTWKPESGECAGTYYGHLFLIGIQKLRTLTRLAGFKIKRIHRTKRKNASTLLFPFIYPQVLFVSIISYILNSNRLRRNGRESDIDIYREIFRVSINPGILVHSHLMVEFEKKYND